MARLHGHAPGCFTPVDPDEYRDAQDASEELFVEEWMSFRGYLFARIRTVRRPAAVAFLFSDTELEHPADRSDFAVPLAA